MNTKYIFSVLLLALFVMSSPSSVVASEHQLYTLSGFVELLITMGVISDENAQKARDYITQTELAESTSKAENSDKLEVSVSQYIEHGSLTYSTFQDVEGLLLIAKNISDATETFEAKRGCQVVYKIYSESDVLLYDSSTEKKCMTDEKVTYTLEAGKSRFFEITHLRNKYALQKGVYRFVLEYPGYGEGEKQVTVN